MDHCWDRRRSLTFFFFFEFFIHNLAIFKKVAIRKPELIGQWPGSAATVPTGSRRLLHEKSYFQMHLETSDWDSMSKSKQYLLV